MPPSHSQTALVEEQHTAEQSSNRKEIRSTSKRANSSGKQDGDQPRKRRARGRPRLDLDAATVADRRREQLRVAQRAYRDRKESTLTTLEKRVIVLEEKQQSMSSELTNFYDEFLAQGLGSLAPGLSVRLKALIGQSAPMEGRHSPSAANMSDSSGLDIHFPDLSHNLPASELPAPSQQQTDESSVQAPEPIFNSSSSDSQQGASNVEQPQTEAPGARTSLELVAKRPSDPYKGIDPFAPASLYFGCVGWTASYAYKEKTFGRRVQRVALEGAAVMCDLAYPDPDCFTAIFGFCLLWESRENIRERVLRLLQRPISETLDDWSFPFTNLGGSGRLTEEVPPAKVPAGMPGEQGFLPIGNYGTSVTSDTQESFGAKPFMGPFSADVESARDAYLDQQMHMMFPDFQGHFFDPNDIELYLRLRGIVIPEGQDFVSTEIDPNDFSHDEWESEPVTPVTLTTHLCAHAASRSSDDWRIAVMDRDGPESMQALLPDSFLSRVDWPAATKDLNFLPPGTAPSLLDPDNVTGFRAGIDQGRKVKVTIDVNRLVTELIQRTVCLGRCPGVRPKHINQAVRLAATLYPFR